MASKKKSEKLSDKMSVHIKASLPKNVFSRHMKRFKKLGKETIKKNTICDPEAKNIAHELLDELKFLELVLKNPTTNQYFIINQSMRCMGLYHQCATRRFFNGASGISGRIKSSQKAEKRAEQIRDLADQIRLSSSKGLNASEIARKIMKRETFWEFLESQNLGRKNDPLKIRALTTIISS